MRSNKRQSFSKPNAVVKKNKTNDTCLAYLHKKWMAILTTRYSYFFNKSPECGQRMELIIDCMKKGLENIFLQFSDLKDTQFNKQIMLPSQGTYSQRMAEMLFYYRLLGMGFRNIKSEDEGPDFIAEKNGETFCFEVVTPTPQENIIELIGQDNRELKDRDLVFAERLLSTTSSIKSKLEQFEKHKSSGHVPEGAHYIIVVNDSLLLPYDKPWHGAMAELCFGDSTLPIVVDATFGSEKIDFDQMLDKESSEDDMIASQYILIKSNLSFSINGGESVTPEATLAPLKIRKSIPTRQRTNTVVVDIAESLGVAGIYQITLREDLMFFHCFEGSRDIMPHSALVSSVKNKALVRGSILCTSQYAKDEDFVQPSMSPAPLMGFDSYDFNNEAIYNDFFKPCLKKEGEQLPDSQDQTEV